MDEPMEFVFGDRAISWLCSQIGQPIGEPLIASAQLALGKGVSLSSVEENVKGIVSKELDDIRGFTARLPRGEYPVY